MRVIQQFEYFNCINQYFEKVVNNQIPVFKDLNDLHKATGFDHKTSHPEFDIFSYGDLDPTCSMCMPPYKQDYYQLSIATNTARTTINLNTKAVELKGYPLWSVVPGQVLSWVREKGLTGYQVNFKKSFLSAHQNSFIEDFPFFKMTENNVLYATEEERQRLSNQMEQLIATFETHHPYKGKILEAQLVALLYDYKSIYDHSKILASELSSTQRLVNQFQLLVNSKYIDSRNVSEYADELNVTPNYLTTSIKEVTGKTAKEVIEERLFTESKNLLSFTNMDVAQVGYTLNFQQPTHFSRFFKKMSGSTPNNFRALL